MAWHLSLENLYHFSKDRRHTFLHGLQIFDMAETYIKLMLNPFSDPPKSHNVTNTLNEYSDTLNKNVLLIYKQALSKTVYLGQSRANNTCVSLLSHNESNSGTSAKFPSSVSSSKFGVWRLFRRENSPEPSARLAAIRKTRQAMYV